MIATEDTVEILTQEGESGLDTVGFSGVNTLDIQKRRGRPTNTIFTYNLTVTAAIQDIYPLPVAYWGNFITLFDGTIVGGTRLDGQGIGWGSSLGSPFSTWASGTTGRPGFPSVKPIPVEYTYNTVGVKGSNAGIDIFFRTSMTDATFGLQWVAADLTTQNTPLVVFGVPQIGSLVPGIITTKRRPEGYNTGENGVQVFFQPQVATDGIPAGFVSPALVGVPSTNSVDLGAVNIRCNLVP